MTKHHESPFGRFIFLLLALEKCMIGNSQTITTTKPMEYLHSYENDSKSGFENFLLSVIKAKTNFII